MTQPWIRPLSVGRFILPNNLVLAPMAGVTDLPWRNLCREWGAGYAVGEMLHATGNVRYQLKTLWPRMRWMTTR